MHKEIIAFLGAVSSIFSDGLIYFFLGPLAERNQFCNILNRKFSGLRVFNAKNTDWKFG